MEHFDYLATSRRGFVQQVACGWVRNGYCFYVQGVVPDGKNLEELDAKFLARYPIRMKASRRHSRKRRGVANVAYLRHERHWILLSTDGRHEPTKEGWLDFRAEESSVLRNCRRGQPILVFGYSISLVSGEYVRGGGRDDRMRVRVQISRRAMSALRAHLVGMATFRDAEWFAERFWRVPFEPYAPVRKQLLGLLRQINAARKRAGHPRITPDVIRFRRRPVKVFR